MQHGRVGHLRSIVEVRVFDEAPFGAIAELVPKLFRDKRDERMQQQQGLAQDKILDRETSLLRRRSLELGLGDFDIPVAEIIPEKAVDARTAALNSNSAKAAVHFARRGEQTLENGVIVGVEFPRLQAGKDRGER